MSNFNIFDQTGGPLCSGTRTRLGFQIYLHPRRLSVNVRQQDQVVLVSKMVTFFYMPSRLFAVVQC